MAIYISTNHQNPDSFYFAFMVSYLKQLTRFQKIDKANQTNHRFKQIKNEFSSLETIQKVDFSYQNVSVDQISAFISSNAFNLRSDFCRIIEQKLSKAKKKHLYLNEKEHERKSLTINEAFFNNVSNFFQISIVLYSNEYYPFKVFSSYPDERMSVMIGFQSNNFHIIEVPGEYEVNTTMDRKALLSEPFYTKVKKTDKTSSKPDNEKVPAPIVPINLDKFLKPLAVILQENCQYIPESIRLELAQKIQFDSRFFALRNRLNDIISCSHENFSIFSCGRQHCETCLREKLGRQGPQNLICSCGTQFSDRDIERLQTQSLNQ